MRESLTQLQVSAIKQILQLNAAQLQIVTAFCSGLMAGRQKEETHEKNVG